MIIVNEQPVAQGDILIRRIDEMPSEVIKLKSQDGKYVVAHSETGHHHAVMERPNVEFYQSKIDESIAYLKVLDSLEDQIPVELKHHRSFDTHQSFGLPKGTYEIRRQMEGSLRGFQRVAD